jgi:signal transduction histidine kinase/ligand-binding sensor domain-containing protein/DNA-binding response OmpR family regulator
MRQFLLFLTTLLLMFDTVCGQTGRFIPSDQFSSSLISNICQDKYGNIWIATDYGLNRFDGYHFQQYLHHDNDTTSLCDNVAVTLLVDSQGRLWVGTNRGLDRFDDAADCFVHYPFPGDIRPRISGMVELEDGSIVLATAGFGAYVVSREGRLRASDDYADKDHNQYFSHVFVDSHQRFWKTGYDNDVVMKKDGRFHLFKSKGEPVGFVERGDEVLVVSLRGFSSYRNGRMTDADIDMSVTQGKDILISSLGKDSKGNIYIGTRGKGLFRIAAGSNTLERYDVNVPGTDLNTAKVWSVLADRQGNLWLGLQRKGLVFVPQRPLQFQNWSFAAQHVNLGSSITSVTEGDDGFVWCTVQGVGVYGFDDRGRIAAHPSAPEGPEFIFRDPRKRYWLGTDDGLYAYNPATGASTLKVKFDCDKFNDMTCDARGNLYISVFSRGFCVYNPETGALRHFRSAGPQASNTPKGTLCNDWILSMTSDREGKIWMGTSSGLSCFDPRTASFRTHGWNQLLNEIMCFSLCQMRDGNIAVGTDRGLFLYDRKQNKVMRFPGSEQLSDKVVNYIVQSNDGDLWCSSSVGIWHYDVQKKAFEGHVNGNGLTKKEYLYGVGLHTGADMVYFGNNDGLTVFSPSRLKNMKPTLSPLRLTSFFVGNQSVNTRTVLNGVQVTEKGVSESEYFTLSYLDHTITLAFSQLTYDNPMNMTYEYRVNGGQWVRNPEGKNDFTLSHLHPGSYRIEVRALQGVDYTPVRVVVVTIRAPWYRSLPAYFLYFLVLAGIAIYLFRSYRRRADDRMNEEKMKFLINATHDIRSPLTIILGALEKLKTGTLLPTAAKGKGTENATTASDAETEEGKKLAVSTIEHNAQRILNLVNQILDVRKIDKQQMYLHCQKTDLVSYVSSVCCMYDFNARERNINFRFVHEGVERLEAWVDRGQFDKVITNLLSNAFKYSYDGGTIELQLTQEGTKAVLKVSDNGVGLDGGSMKHVFERFYQGSNSRRLHINGTGIGLNLCKMIVDMHHGTIEASNRTDGERGSVFTVKLPLGTDHLKPEEMESSVDTENTPLTVDPPIRQQGGGIHRVLVVDDDVEIGNYISTELGRYYKFTVCVNGREAMKELLANPYDVVVSDVMMPEMDGFTMLRMIKTNLNISHIPVIMLTSKTDVGNRLEGLERGADAFLAKPFNMEELHLNIENLIHTRQHLRGKFSGAQQQTERVELPEVKGNDELLMERIMKAVNQNLSNSDFNVDMLTQEVGISRAQLHRKMKEITGISTSEFIRNIRLEQAARLLREQKINVTQVAYTVGFSNLAHFSTIFRKHFGMSPSEYAENHAES